MQIFSNSTLNSTSSSAQTEDTGSSSGTGSAYSTSASNPATISANDFLQLLVSELKNQDPTADTDPNQYINQLVQVNSLEQLISINQDLTPTSSTGTSSGSGGGTGQVTGGSSTPSAAMPGTASGNLSVPNTGSFTSRIANALGTAAQTLAPASSASPLDSVLSTLRARGQQARTSTSNPAH